MTMKAHAAMDDVIIVRICDVRRETRHSVSRKRPCSTASHNTPRRQAPPNTRMAGRVAAVARACGLVELLHAVEDGLLRRLLHLRPRGRINEDQQTR